MFSPRGIIALAWLSAALSVGLCANCPLTLDDRLQAQEAIERVYYRHRIWPKENPEPKPTFEEMVQRSAIEAKVTDYLGKCSILDETLHQPIQPEQLQAEMDRMAKWTKDPAFLNELFAALGNDPYLIAECLARPIVAERLYRRKVADGRLPSEPHMGAAKLFGALEHAEQQSYRMPGQPFGSARSSETGWQPCALEGEIDQRFGHTAIWTGAEMIVWGGHNSRSSILTGGRYDPSTDTWVATSTGQNCPGARLYHSAVWTGSEMVVWGGGTDAHWGQVNTGARYCPAGDKWLPMSTGQFCPAERSSHTAIWTGAEMIVWGGEVYGGSCTNTGGIYNPETDEWFPTSTGQSCPPSRSLHTALWTGSSMIIWGGRSPFAALDSGGIYDPLTDKWTEVPSGAGCPTARYEHTATWCGSEMLIWGGCAPEGDFLGYTETGWRFDPSSGSWREIASSLESPSARAYHSAVWSGTELLIWGGYGPGPGDFGEGSRYDPATDSWFQIWGGSGSPQARHGHTAVWTGAEMIVWGGCAGELVFNSGGRFKPAAGTWRETSTGNGAPVRRFDHTAVWTGTEMIVWGGMYYSGANPKYLKTGGRYTPSTDSWMATPTDGACPFERYGHTAVWTGVEMIIWGGHPYLSNSGGRYNPASDLWKPTSTSGGAPVARYGHTAIWTGDRMIIWGGFGRSGPQPLNEGGIYQPSTDSWVPTSSGANCPEPRGYHSAVWTGRRMIVWGGKKFGIPYYENGSQFDPTDDSWSPISPPPVELGARSGHTAVWTGHDMVVWGGNDDNYEYLGAGGYYSPSNDAWTAIPADPVSPHGRVEHTAVWTGAQMLAWGGWFRDPGRSEVVLGDGWLLTPGSNLWEELEQDPRTPSPRSGHTAVWTGSDMIIWGGSPETATGGIYHLEDPLCTLSCSASASTASGISPLVVTFAASATADNCTGSPAFEWDFGDGSSSVEQNPSHTYAAGGSYSWTVAVIYGSKRCLQADTVVVTEPCSVACEASASPSQGRPPLSVSFSSSAALSHCSQPASFSWDFGDGTGSSEQNPAHTYTGAGNFSWVLTVVVDDQSCSHGGTIRLVLVPGDCDGDDTVSIGEVQKAINMFLGTLAPDCGVDCDGNGQVSIGELQKVINAFLGMPTTC